MDKEQQNRVVQQLVDTLYADRIVPKQVIHQFALLVGDVEGDLEPKFLEIWNEKTEERKKKNLFTLDPNVPLLLSRGYDRVVAEDELKRYLPEEKILINRDLFRSRLAKVDFARLDSQKERQLLDSLKNDSLGLTQEIVLLYYNLIKLHQLSERAASSGESNLRSSANVNVPKTVLELIEKAFALNAEKLARINGGKPLDRAILLEALTDGFKRNKINPSVALNFYGLKSNKWIEMVLAFLRMGLMQRNDNPEEVITHAGLYLILNGCDPRFYEKLGLSIILKSFIEDKIGRVRPIYYFTLKFIHTVSYVLFAQIYEISCKFHEADEEQKDKLVRLYNTEERIGMLINNAVNLGGRRIADNKVEFREIQGNFKRFLGNNKDLVSAHDLFKADYTI